MIDPLLSSSTVADHLETQCQSSNWASPARDQYYDDLWSFGWISIGRGIVLAGASYPVILSIIYLLVGVAFAMIESGASVTDRGFIAMAFIGAGMLAAFGAIGGTFWSGLVAVVTLPTVHLVIRSLKARPSLVWLGAFSGGLIAFLAILPATMQFPRMLNQGQAWGSLLILLVGPGLATIVGQVGGAIGGARGLERIATSRAAPKIELLRMKFDLGVPPASNPPSAIRTESSDSETAQFRFRIVHLLWIGVWASLLLTVIRLSGIPYKFILPALIGWALYQLLTLIAGGWLVRRLG